MRVGGGSQYAGNPVQLFPHSRRSEHMYALAKIDQVTRGLFDRGKRGRETASRAVRRTVAVEGFELVDRAEH